MSEDILDGFEKQLKKDSEGNQLYILPIEDKEVFVDVPRTFKSTEETEVQSMVTVKVPLMEDGVQKEYEVTQPEFDERGNIVGQIGTGQFLKLWTTEDVQEKNAEGELLFWKTEYDQVSHFEPQPDELITSSDERYVEGLEEAYDIVPIPPVPLTAEEFRKLQDDKINYLDKLREISLTSGFTSIVNDVETEFSYDTISQNRFTKQGTLLSINPSITEVQWGTKNQGFIVVSREVFIDILNDAAQHELQIEFKYLYAKAHIMNSTTVEEIDAIVNSW